MKIHPTAIIDKQAKLASDVEVGPYCVIGPNVEIQAGTKLANHVVIEGYTQIGRNCQIFSGACLGGIPQDKKYKAGTRSYLKIGHENIIREYVTMNLSSEEGKSTIVGDRNLFMIGTHVGHDCVVGNDVVIANQAALGGHVVIEDHAVIGGLCGIHQFVRVGQYAMVSALSKTAMDAPPFSMVHGNPAGYSGHNAVGLRRAGFPREEVIAAKKALKALFASNRNLSIAAVEVEKELGSFNCVRIILAFLKQSKRGIIRASEAALETVSE